MTRKCVLGCMIYILRYQISLPTTHLAKVHSALAYFTPSLRRTFHRKWALLVRMLQSISLSLLGRLFFWKLAVHPLPGRWPPPPQQWNKHGTSGLAITHLWPRSVDDPILIVDPPNSNVAQHTWRLQNGLGGGGPAQPSSAFSCPRKLFNALSPWTNTKGIGWWVNLSYLSQWHSSPSWFRIWHHWAPLAMAETTQWPQGRIIAILPPMQLPPVNSYEPEPSIYANIASPPPYFISL